MKKYKCLLLLPFIAACGQNSEQAERSRSEDLTTHDVSEAAPPALRYEPSSRGASAEGGPNIGVTAAPGVAFNYRYAFRLPAQAIAGVQEQHAQTCEKLGVNRCRITGLRYRVVNESDIEGMLAFKLDPAVARHFGKAGVEAVTKAEGMLVDSEISGTDAGAAIQSVNRAVSQLNEDLARIETQLRARGLGADERARLQSEAQRIRESIRANRTSREEQEDSLATTPVVFTYGSGDLVPGFDAHSPVRDALAQAWRNFIGGVAVMFVIFATLLPWLALGTLAWFLVRLILPRVRPRRREVAPPAVQQQSASGEE